MDTGVEEFVIDGGNHMQYQIRDPKGFAGMLDSVIEKGKLGHIKVR